MTCCEERALEWSDEAGSHICTSCGSLLDPSQSVLSVPEYNVNALGHASYNPWDHSRESRDAKQLAVIKQFISSLCVSLSCTGVQDQTTTLFMRAKNAPIQRFTWGRKARLIAAACLYITLREARQSCSLYDLSNLLSEDRTSSLVRCIFDVSSTLKLPFVPSDPSIHIPDLFNYLSATLSEQPKGLPDAIVKALTAPTFSLRQASHTAEAITALLARHGPDHPLSSLPTPPTACACFMLAIEGELRASLSNVAVLAEHLGIRLKIGKAVVMKRYKLVQDELMSCVERVPWLKSYDSKDKGSRAKTGNGKRSLVAKGLLDILRFQEEIWKNKLVKVDLQVESPSPDAEFHGQSDSTIPATTPLPDLPQLALQREEVAPPRALKRRKTTHDKENRPMDEATRFLINPLEAHIPTLHYTDDQYPDNSTHIPQHSTFNSNSTIPPPPLTLPQTLGPTSFQSNSAAAPTPQEKLHTKRSRQVPLSFASYLLTAPTPNLGGAVTSDLGTFFFEDMKKKPPTRLQMLTAHYGSAEAVPDEELFGEGEWQRLLRDDAEREVVESIMREKGEWESDGEEEEKEQPVKARVGRKRKSREGEQPPGKKKSRINVDALASFMTDDAVVPGDYGADYEDERERQAEYSSMFLGLQRFDSQSGSEKSPSILGLSDDEDDGADDSNTPSTRATSSTGKEEVIVDDWRPASPVSGGGDWDEDWY